MKQAVSVEKDLLCSAKPTICYNNVVSRHICQIQMQLDNFRSEMVINRCDPFISTVYRQVSIIVQNLSSGLVLFRSEG